MGDSTFSDRLSGVGTHSAVAYNHGIIHIYDILDHYPFTVCNGPFAVFIRNPWYCGSIYADQWICHRFIPEWYRDNTDRSICSSVLWVQPDYEVDVYIKQEVFALAKETFCRRKEIRKLINTHNKTEKQLRTK